jgi:hypothetical protein
VGDPARMQALRGGSGRRDASHRWARARFRFNPSFGLLLPGVLGKAATRGVPRPQAGAGTRTVLRHQLEKLTALRCAKSTIWTSSSGFSCTDAAQQTLNP